MSLADSRNGSGRDIAAEDCAAVLVSVAVEALVSFHLCCQLLLPAAVGGRGRDSREPRGGGDNTHMELAEITTTLKLTDHAAQHYAGHSDAGGGIDGGGGGDVSWDDGGEHDQKKATNAMPMNGATYTGDGKQSGSDDEAGETE